MITPGEIKQKAFNYWRRQRVLRAWLNEEPLFPLAISCTSPGSRILSDHFGQVRDWIAQLKAASVKGFRIEYKEINHRQLGRQQIPRRIVFDTRDVFLNFIGKSAEFACFVKLAESTLARWPGLKAWFAQKPLTVLSYAEQWPRLLAVCAYFENNPCPDLYLRQLSIPGVDSKFIEQHKSVLTELLECILPEHAVDRSVSGLAEHGFERRFGLRFDPPLVRFRVLDPAQAITGLRDLSIPLADFRRLRLPATRVFITENKINGLSFPDLSDAAVIFGLGYGVRLLAEVSWLADKSIYYWGDIDTHGFAILSQLRGYWPHTQSFLMDEETLQRFRDLWVHEDDAKRFTGELQWLNEAEDKVFKAIRDNRIGANLRLEQERIDYRYLLQQIEIISPASIQQAKLFLKY